MNPKKVNTYTAHIPDMDKNEVGSYFRYGGLPQKVGDLVILEVYPHFEDVMESYEYEQVKKHPPEYRVLAEVTRFVDDYGTFFCKILRVGDKV